jgi:hypothetical protein
MLHPLSGITALQKKLPLNEKLTAKKIQVKREIKITKVE